MLSQQRKSCHNITVIIYNQGQHNLYHNKDYFCRDKQNIKEVNSLSQQDAEEEHKKNGNKEILISIKSMSYRQNLCRYRIQLNMPHKVPTKLQQEKARDIGKSTWETVWTYASDHLQIHLQIKDQ